MDYRVLTDAARFVLDGESPFVPPTYRLLLAPKYQVFSSFGKVEFVLCDLLVGLLIHLVLSARGLRRTKITFPVALWLLNPLTATASSRGVGLIHLVLSAQGLRRTKIIFPVAHLALKPINSYSIKPRKCRVHPCCLGAVTLYFLIRRRVYIPAIFFGLAVHLKLFLVIYSLPIYLFIKGGLYLKPTKLEHIFVAVITFFPFLL